MSDKQVWRIFTIAGVTLIVALFIAILWPHILIIMVANAALLTMTFFLGRYIQIRKEVKYPREKGKSEL